MKLTIQNGIIQNDQIAGIPFYRRIVEPVGNANVRTLIPLNPKGITNHNTGNNAPTANAMAHANWLSRVENLDQDYIGAHFFVDGRGIVQCLPLTEVAWHAGDGRGPGNMTTIAIEICDIEPYAQAESHAIRLNQALRATYGPLPIYKHQDWNGKYCPHKILRRNGWNEFVQKITHPQTPPIENSTPTPNNPQAPASWAKIDCDWAKQQKLIQGDGKSVPWKKPITYEMLASILHRYDQNQEQGKNPCQP